MPRKQVNKGKSNTWLHPESPARLESITVRAMCGRVGKYWNPSDIKEHLFNDGWLEFTSSWKYAHMLPKAIQKRRHTRMMYGVIVAAETKPTRQMCFRPWCFATPFESLLERLRLLKTMFFCK